MDKARRRLLEEKARIEAALAAARSMERDLLGSGLSQVGQHPADLATDVTDRETAAALEATLEVEVRRVEVALAQVDRGEYGRCGICGREIEEERLEVTPWARTCIEHREEEARLPELVA